MLIIRVFLLFMVLILVETINISRQNVDLKMESRSKVKKRGASREMFYDLFQIYDPSFLAAVWPKITNGVHLLLDVSCWKDMSVFFKDLSEGKSWAYSAVDASGHYQSGLFSGNRFWLGSKEQCERLDAEFVNSRSNESLQAVDYAAEIRRNDRSTDYGGHDWRWVLNHNELIQHHTADERPPLRLAYAIVDLALNISKFAVPKMYNIIMGICMPRSCSIYDIESVINFSIMINEKLKSNRTLPRTARIITVRQMKSYDYKTDLGAIVLIGLTGLLILLGTIATAAELGIIKCAIYNKNAMSFDLEKYNKNNDKILNKQIKIINELNSTKVDNATNVNPIKIANAKVATDSSHKLSTPVSMEVVSTIKDNCQRCGKYRQQCTLRRPGDNISSCSRVRDNSTSTTNIEYQSHSTFCRLLLCFSFVYSWKRIFNKNTSNKDLSLIHSLKITATFCVMFVHVALMVDYISANASDVNERNNVYYILIIGTIAFDTLFFVSGVISSHHFFFLKSRYTIEELVNFGGKCGQILQFVCFVTNRIIRMLPSYVYAILLSAVLTRVYRDTATLSLPDGDDTNCNTYWWRNLLYVSNMYPEDEQCMQISWYLSTETQLHAVGALACAASVSARMLASVRTKLVASVAFAVLLAATTADISAAYFDDRLVFSSAFDAYSSVIDRPLARVAPYFLGVFSGWLVHEKHGGLTLSKMSSYALWLVSVSLLSVTWTVPFILPGSWPAAFVHASWPLGLIWPTLVCSTKYASSFRGALSSSAMSGVSRLCVGVLLLQAAAARVLLLGSAAPACSNALCLWIYYTATSVLTILGALVLSLLVEMPSCSLLRRLSDCATT